MTRSATRRPPIGSVWRTLAHGRMKSFSTYSRDMTVGRTFKGETTTVIPERTIFDELVIEGVLHVEQMDDAYWWIGIPTRDGGLIHVDIRVDKRKRAAKSVMVRDDRSDTTCRLNIDANPDAIEGRAAR